SCSQPAPLGGASEGVASCGLNFVGIAAFTAPLSLPGASFGGFFGLASGAGLAGGSVFSSSILSPDLTLSGRAARVSVSVSTKLSFSLMKSQFVFLSPGLGLSRTSTQPPLSFSPHRRNLKSPFLNPSSTSPIGAQSPVSHTIIGPPPYSPSGMTPSKSMYSIG